MQRDEPITTPEKNLGILSLVEPPLSRREYFAAMAMQGLLANAEQWKYMGRNNLNFQDQITGLSVNFANALIERLSKEPKK